MSLSHQELEQDRDERVVNRALIDWLLEESSFTVAASASVQTEEAVKLCRLLSLWLGIVEANSFALEVPAHSGYGRAKNLLRQVAKRQIGTAVFGAASYFNHSCDPNVTFTVGSGKAIMVATRSVRAGQELCISYGPTFPYQTRAQRHNYVRT